MPDETKVIPETTDEDSDVVEVQADSTRDTLVGEMKPKRTRKKAQETPVKEEEEEQETLEERFVRGLFGI